MIGEVLERCKRIPGVDEVVCAIPFEPGALGVEVEKYCRPIVYVGDENDLLGRYVAAAAATEADTIMRVTGDCPLICPEICGAVLALHKRMGSGYICNVLPIRTFPKGLDCEVFSRDMLMGADAYATEPYDREHVTPWMQTADNAGPHLMSPWPMEGRLCLDTWSDYEVICAAFGHEADQRLRPS